MKYSTLKNKKNIQIFEKNNQIDEKWTIVFVWNLKQKRICTCTQQLIERTHFLESLMRPFSWMLFRRGIKKVTIDRLFNGLTNCCGHLIIDAWKSVYCCKFPTTQFDVRRLYFCIIFLLLPFSARWQWKSEFITAYNYLNEWWWVILYVCQQRDTVSSVANMQKWHRIQHR